LLAREVDYSYDKLPYKLFWFIKRRDLCAGFFNAKLIAKIHMEDVGRLARLFEHRRLYDTPDAKLYFQKIIKGYEFHMLSLNG